MAEKRCREEERRGRGEVGRRTRKEDERRRRLKKK